MEGTGSKGRLVREDIEAYVKHQLTYSAPVAAPVGDSVLAGLPDWPKIDFEKFGPIERKELSRIARILGPALSRNALIIPHVCNFDKADITSLEAFRKVLSTEASSDDAKISLLTFAVKAVVSALKAYPLFNSSLEEDEVVIKQYWHIGIAVDTPNGLMVPVIRDVDRKSIRDVANEMQQLAVKARSGKLSQTELSGATFTISSLGGVGGTGFVPIIPLCQTSCRL
nr:2-oxo acid dehydrogenase subunit E2 [uncultured Amphritea sp.]